MRSGFAFLTMLLLTSGTRADFDLARAQPIAARTAALALVAAKTCQGFRLKRDRLDSYLGLVGLTLGSAEERFGTEMDTAIRDFAALNATGNSRCDEAFQRLGPSSLNLLSR